MSSPRDGGNDNDLVAKIGSMSDSDLDALLAGSVAGHAKSGDPFAEIAQKMASSSSGRRPQESPEPSTPSSGKPLGALTEDGSLDISFSDYEPPQRDAGVFGKDEGEVEKIDPTQVPDQGVQSSVRDRSSAIDYAALNPDSDGFDPDAEDYPEIDENGDPVLPEDTRFAPRRPVAPDADENAAPAEPGAFGHPRSDDDGEGVDYSRRWQEDQADFLDDDEDDTESGPGFLTKAKDKYTSLPGYLQIALPLVLVIAVIMGVVLTGGEDTTGTGSGTTTGGGGGQVANEPADVPGGEASGDAEVLTAHIKTVSARCADGSTGASTAFSPDPAVAWVCHRVHGIDGAVLNIVFSKPVTITEISMTPGFDFVRQPSGDDEWNRHRVVSNVLWRAGGKQFPQEIVASRGRAVLTLDEPVVTESMSLTIQRSVSPSEAEGDAPAADPFTEDFTGQDPEVSPDDVLDATAIQNIEIVGTVR